MDASAAASGFMLLLAASLIQLGSAQTANVTVSNGVCPTADWQVSHWVL